MRQGIRAGVKFLVISAVITVLMLAVGPSARAQLGPDYTSGVQIADREASAAQVTLTLFDASGGQIGSPITDTIPANGSKTYFPLNDVVRSGCPGGRLTGAGLTVPAQATRLVFPRETCVLVVTSDQQLASIVNLLSVDFQRGGSYLYDGVGATTVYLPLLNQSNGGFDTWFSLINLGSDTATVAVSYSDGLQVSASIPKDSAQTFSQTAETHQQRIFAATITSDQPVFAAVVQENSEILFAYSGFTQGATDPVFPLINFSGAGYVTGLQIQNAGTVTTTVEVSYTPIAGTACAETQPIEPGASRTFALLAFHSGANSTCAAGQRFIGSARVTGNSATQPLIGIGNQLLPGINGGTYRAFDPALATDRVLMPLIMDRNNGFFTGFSVQNIGSAATEVTCTFVNSDYTVAQTLQPGEAIADIQSQKLGVRYVGSATCTASNAAAQLVAVVNELGSAVDADQLLVYEGIPNP